LTKSEPCVYHFASVVDIKKFLNNELYILVWKVNEGHIIV